MDEESLKAAARRLKRNQLVRSFQSVVTQYPKAAGRRREEVVDELIALEDAGRLSIEFDTVEHQIICRLSWLS